MVTLAPGPDHTTETRLTIVTDIRQAAEAAARDCSSPEARAALQQFGHQLRATERALQQQLSDESTVYRSTVAPPTLKEPIPPQKKPPLPFPPPPAKPPSRMADTMRIIPKEDK